ncbi:hypothetical protein GKZ89_05340 [Bacillus mangrovi]|uniref:MFS transporter n=1 Tax=Metabacillus mangrovi TaxID=1491830 RepID=A0A7X2S402_9BACI|nr:hypothetical protein [Metabacillus mangrovi]MTH52826.1 hypothetical protein [Metabacillus mangrovi]
MWIILGAAAIAVTVINLFMYAAGKDYKLAMAAALSLTALTICADYSSLNGWVKAEDWGAISDVVPSMANALWFLTIASILLNTAPLLLERVRK